MVYVGTYTQGKSKGIYLFRMDPASGQKAETRTPQEGVAVIRLEGEVDVYTSPRLKQEMVDLLNQGLVHLVVDLNDVKYLDSTGLGLLIGGLRRARERGGDLRLICDNMRILRIFEITGLTKIFDIDRREGDALLTPAGLAAETVNPSFLAIAPNHRFLYAVNEIGEFGGTSSGAVSAFAIDPSTGKLTLLNQESSRGAGPCHLVVDTQGKNVLVANYGGGSVAVLPIRPDGRLGPATAFIQHQGSSVNPQRQKEPHAHSMNLDAANRFAFAADLGLDKVLIYRFDPTKGSLDPNEPPSVSVAPGAGPRHFAFHPSGRWAYVINEINSTVTAFSYDAKTGALKTVQTISTLPEGFTGNNSTAEIQVHPSGKFLYGSNRGDDSLAIFRIDPDTGRLTSVGRQSTQGKTPRGFGIDPTGTFLLAANQDSDSVVVFRIDPETGKLQPTGQVVEVPKPVCVQFMPTAR